MGGTGVLVVDMQHVFDDPGSAWCVPGFGSALDGCERLLAAHERRAVTRFVPAERPVGAWVDYAEAWEVARVDATDQRWDLVPQVAAYDAPVVDAASMGKWSAATAAVLGDPDTLVLAGVATECCVLATALAAADTGVRVRLVGDACAGGTPADHGRALAVVAAFAPLVEVVTLDDVC